MHQYKTKNLFASLVFFLWLIFFVQATCAQQKSIHMEQSLHYGKLGDLTAAQYDSIQQNEEVLYTDGIERGGGENAWIQQSAKDERGQRITEHLQKRVFGYHPYWIGSAWQNYQWDLLSDLCYFSYEADPASGNAIDLHDFLTDPAIDTALAHGVRVHLCVTLFSGHATFFANQTSQQQLISNLISLVTQRGIQGINIDFEAVPSSQQQGLTAFIQSLSTQLHSAVPGAELSIAAPAVNWNNTFDMPNIAPWLDLVMIMAYDYYWSGSPIAGPVSGFWPLTSSINYSVNRSLTYYQSKGVEPQKLLLGLPYYGREWPVASNTLPAQTTGSGVALTYRQIRNGGSNHYKPSNLYWDWRSYNPYYSYTSGTWRQCFFDDTRSLGIKYNLVNCRNIAGIGIWALGYDNGYDDLWNLIEEKFTGSPSELCRDTIYDSGGPWWDYQSEEAYIETIESAYSGPLNLYFNMINLEPGNDTIWIYDGNSVNDSVLAVLSGIQTPERIYTSSNVFTIKFKSDDATEYPGYELVWSCPTYGIEEYTTVAALVYPNPVNSGGVLNIIDKSTDLRTGNAPYRLINIAGRVISQGLLNNGTLKLPDIPGGVYLVKISLSKGKELNQKIIVLPE